MLFLFITTSTAESNPLPISDPRIHTETQLRPYWSTEVKAGRFTPDLDNWEMFYGDEDMGQLSIAFAYKFTSQWETGFEIAYARDKGEGILPLNNTTGGNVTYNLFPVHAFVLFRGLFKENQMLVPYIGGGLTRTFYRQEINAQANRYGDTNGEHLRIGLQILLDRADESAASEIQKGFGIDHTYLVIEAQSFSAKTNNIELGGDSISIGLLFEY